MDKNQKNILRWIFGTLFLGPIILYTYFGFYSALAVHVIASILTVVLIFSFVRKDKPVFVSALESIYAIYSCSVLSSFFGYIVTESIVRHFQLESIQHAELFIAISSSIIATSIFAVLKTRIDKYNTTKDQNG